MITEITMKKTFVLEDLDCANCAAKIENAVKELEHVISASVSFMTQKLVLEAPDEKFEEVVKRAVRSIEKYSENQRKGKDKRNDSFIRVLIHFQKDFCKTP